MHLLITTSIFLATIGLAHAAGEKPLSPEALPKALHVGNVKQYCKTPLNGHGPYLWCTPSPSGKETWFWFVPQKQTKPDKFRIAFITELEDANPEKQTIIWPSALREQSVEAVYQSTYSGFSAEEP